MEHKTDNPMSKTTDDIDDFMERHMLTANPPSGSPERTPDNTVVSYKGGCKVVDTELSVHFRDRY